ncbi:hypothetical protein [Pseudonocardia phyllosphaerae]|uniref:hypothetical protein n=1 Tax=Pseudonocardia phyllosphaerae TaxID=3390502 RepID=UPI00397E051C
MNDTGSPAPDHPEHDRPGCDRPGCERSEQEAAALLRALGAPPMPGDVAARIRATLGAETARQPGPPIPVAEPRSDPLRAPHGARGTHGTGCVPEVRSTRAPAVSSSRAPAVRSSRAAAPGTGRRTGARPAARGPRRGPGTRRVLRAGGALLAVAAAAVAVALPLLDRPAPGPAPVGDTAPLHPGHAPARPGGTGSPAP